MVSRLREQVPQVNGVVMPGARFERVTRDINQIPPGKTIVIIGGTNNTHDTSKTPKEILADFDLDKIKQASKTNPIIMVEILKRYDNPEINNTIRKLNLNIKTIVRHYKKHNLIRFVKTDDLGKNLYTKISNTEYSIHLNYIGKNVLAQRIAETYYLDNPRPNVNLPKLDYKIELGKVIEKRYQ